jgi:hypothetical protein
LVQSLIATCYDVRDRTNFLSLTNGTGNTVPTNTLGVSFTAQNAPQCFSIQLLSGVCGTLARSYVPVYDLTGNLELRIQLNLPAKVQAVYGSYTTANCAYYIDNVTFHCNFIKLDPMTINEIRTPVYDIHTEMYSQFGSTISLSTTTLETVVPIHVSSLKSLFVVPCNNNSTSNCSFSGRSSYTMIDYCFKVGSSQIPPVRVKCLNSSFTEPFCELSKALHLMGTLQTRGLHNSSLYSGKDSTTNNTATPTFVIGQDFDSLAHKSGELLQGYNTKNSDIYFSATYDAAGVSTAGINDSYALYDAILHIENGMMTASY